MNSGFSDNFMRGAQLVLQAHGIKDQKEQQQWMQKLWQSRLETEGLQREHLTRGMENEEMSMAQDAMQKERTRKAMQGAFGMEQINTPFGGTITTRDIPPPGQEESWIRQRTMNMLPALAETGDIGSFTNLAKELFKNQPESFESKMRLEQEKAKLRPMTEAQILSLAENDPRKIAYIKGKTQLKAKEPYFQAVGIIEETNEMIGYDTRTFNTKRVPISGMPIKPGTVKAVDPIKQVIADAIKESQGKSTIEFGPGKGLSEREQLIVNIIKDLRTKGHSEKQIAAWMKEKDIDPTPYLEYLK